MIAASASTLNRLIISDVKAFDRIPHLRNANRLWVIVVPSHYGLLKSSVTSIASMPVFSALSASSLSSVNSIAFLLFAV